MKKDVIIKECTDIVKTMIVAFVFVLIMLIFLQPAVVYGESMEPNYKHGDRFFIVRDWLIKEYEYGDIVCIGVGNEVYVKRIIGLPGDTISFEDGFVYRNGSKIDESAYLPADTITNSYEKEFTIDDGCYFVLGDNRGNSNDSRYIGQVESLWGRAWFFYRQNWFRN